MQRQLADQEKRLVRLETQAGYYETFVDEVSTDLNNQALLGELLGNLKNQLDTIDEESN
jgi:uncharacterized coiled-coil protein SlyX